MAKFIYLYLLLAILCGCGQKGPLYLPTDALTTFSRLTK
ncbi:MAG: LPS translocon maturation chaperone LptM [Legionella sp.]